MRSLSPSAGSLGLLAVLGCGGETVFIGHEALEPAAWVVVVSMVGGAPAEVHSVLNLELGTQLSLTTEDETELWLVALAESDLPFAPEGPLRAGLGTAPTAPQYSQESASLRAVLPIPAAARLLHLQADGRLIDEPSPALRGGLRLELSYAADAPLRLELDPRSGERFREARALHRAATGGGFGASNRAQQIIPIDEARTIILIPQLLLLVDRNNHDAFGPFLEGSPSPWYPSSSLGEESGPAQFRSALLSRRSAPSEGQTLFVVGRNGIGEGRVWSFELGPDGLSFEGEVPFEAPGPVPDLGYIAADADNTIIVAADAGLFLATKAEASNVFTSNDRLDVFLAELGNVFRSPPQLTFIGAQPDAGAPHVLGLNAGWLLEGDVRRGVWRKVVDLRDVSGDAQNLHVLSHVHSQDGDTWVSTRHGHLFERRAGASEFRELNLMPDPLLASCADPDRGIVHHLLDLALTETHGFLVNRECSAILRVRLEDGYVSPILADDDLMAQVITSTTVGFNCGQAHAGRYFVGGFEARLDFAEMR